MVVFDLDGTLIDCEKRQVSLAAAILEQLPVAGLQKSLFWKGKRNGRTTFESLVNQGYSSEISKYVADQWSARIEDPEWLELDQPFAEAFKAVEACSAKDGTAMILTARRHPDRLFDQLASFLLPTSVQVEVVSPLNAAREKSNILRQSRARLFVGDTESDLSAATLALVPFLGVSWGQRSSKFLQTEGARIVIDTPTQLVDHIDNW